MSRHGEASEVAAMSRHEEGAGGNREVPPIEILGACAEADLAEEGGPRGKHGFPRASELEASEVVG